MTVRELKELLYQESVCLLRELLNSEEYYLALLVDGAVEGYRELKIQGKIVSTIKGLYYSASAREVKKNLDALLKNDRYDIMVLCVDCSLPVLAPSLLKMVNQSHYFIVSNDTGLKELAIIKGFSGVKNGALNGVSLTLSNSVNMKVLSGMESQVVQINFTTTEHKLIDYEYDFSKFIKLKTIHFSVYLSFMDSIGYTEDEVLVLNKWKEAGYQLEFDVNGLAETLTTEELDYCILLHYFGKLLAVTKRRHVIELDTYSLASNLYCYKIQGNFNGANKLVPLCDIFEYVTSDEIDFIRQRMISVEKYIDNCLNGDVN